MTIGNAAIQGLQNAEAQFDRVAARIANPNQGVSQGSDEVSLSDEAVALLQARTEVAVSVSALRAAGNMQKELLTVFG